MSTTNPKWEALAKDVFYNRALLTVILDELAHQRAERLNEQPIDSKQAMLDMVQTTYRALRDSADSSIDRHNLENL